MTPNGVIFLRERGSRNASVVVQLSFYKPKVLPKHCSLIRDYLHAVAVSVDDAEIIEHPHSLSSRD